MLDTKDKYTAEFISETLLNFSNLTGTQVNSIKNIMLYNNIFDMTELVNHIKACFSYTGSKSSADYKKIMYSEEGFKLWQKEYNNTRVKAKTENQQDPQYVKNMYCESICKEIDNIRDKDFVYEIIKDYIPLKEIVRDIIIRVLKLNRFSNIRDFKKNISQLVDFNGSRSNNNRDYGVILLGEEGYEHYMKNAISSMKETKKDIFESNKDSVERIKGMSNTIIKKYSLMKNIDFVSQVIIQANEFDIRNDLHKRWLGELLKYDLGDYSVSDYVQKINNIISYTGNKHVTNHEWNLLRFGDDYTKVFESSLYKFTSNDNPATTHNGKYSKFSKNFIYGYDDEWNLEFSKTHSEFQKNNPNNPFKREYYENDEEYHKFQSKNLDFYILRYGEVEGNKKFKEKELIKNISIYSKIDDYELAKSIPCTFYIIKLTDNTFKFGITTKTVSERYSKNTLKDLSIIYENKSSLLECANTEIKFKIILNEYVISKKDKIDVFGYTETVSGIEENYILSLIKKDE